MELALMRLSLPKMMRMSKSSSQVRRARLQRIFDLSNRCPIYFGYERRRFFLQPI